MVGSVSGLPTLQQLKEAFQAGFDSIDEGDGFYFGFHSYLESNGFKKREDIPCTCVDNGAHGHQPECRWIRA